MALNVKNVDWSKNKRILSKLREQVFVYEWHIPRESEFDQQDLSSYHVLLFDDDNQEIATGRITPNGELGRIAVMPRYRQAEVYHTLLNALLDIAKQQGMNEISVQCELQGVEYYQQQGFRTVGPVYMDAGIARQKMAKSVGNFSLPRIELTH